MRYATFDGVTNREALMIRLRLQLTCFYPAPSRQPVIRRSILAVCIGLNASQLWANPHQLPPQVGPAAAPAQRIISLSLASDEIVYELLKSKAQLHRLTALSALAHDERYSFLAELFAAQDQPGQPAPPVRVPAHIEPIVKLKPDLVIAAKYNNPKLLAHLRNTKIPVVLLENFSTIAHIKANILRLGHALHLPQPAAALVVALDGELASRSHLLHPAPVISMLMYTQSGYAVGEDTLFDDMLRHSGFVNAVTTPGWSKLTQEALLLLDPDFIVAPCSPRRRLPMLRQLREQRGWSRYEALRQGRLICIQNRALYSTSFHLTQALRELKTGYQQLTAQPK